MGCDQRGCIQGVVPWCASRTKPTTSPASASAVSSLLSVAVLGHLMPISNQYFHCLQSRCHSTNSGRRSWQFVTNIRRCIRKSILVHHLNRRYNIHRIPAIVAKIAANRRSFSPSLTTCSISISHPHVHHTTYPSSQTTHHHTHETISSASKN